MATLKRIAFFILFVITGLPAWSQGEIDTQQKLLFENERSINLSLNSNGFAAGYRFGKRKTYLTKTLFEMEIAYIKHPKEVKISADPYSYGASRRFVDGKTNIFVDFRPTFGFQKEIFSKEDKGSIAVKYYVGGGPSIGVTKPIYYTFNVLQVYQQEIYVVGTVDGKYDYQFSTANLSIAGRSTFWKGFDELKVYPGLHAKGGFVFEYSKYNKILNAIDISATVDAFPEKIPIMYTKYNNQFFLTLTVGYRFGWMVPAKHKTPKITKEGRRKSDS